jgi:hypothetical protein
MLADAGTQGLENLHAERKEEQPKRPEEKRDIEKILKEIGFRDQPYPLLKTGFNRAMMHVKKKSRYG